MDSPKFAITLHHLAPDAKKAGVDFPDTELPEVSQKQLRALIRALSALAAKEHGPAVPELRVSAPHGQFVVQILGGRLRINSWTMRVGGADLTPDQIFALITGAEAVADAAGIELAAGGGRRHSRLGLIVLVAVLIIASNATTAWFLLRTPPPPLLPEFTSLGREPAERLLAGVEGEYQTSANAGGRALVIAASGRAHWRTFGPEHTVLEEQEFPLQPVQSHGRPALLADDRALIEITDAAALVFYNETYRRKVP